MLVEQRRCNETPQCTVVLAGNSKLLVLLLNQGSHVSEKPAWKCGIVGEFHVSENVRELSGNFILCQRNVLCYSSLTMPMSKVRPGFLMMSKYKLLECCLQIETF